MASFTTKWDSKSLPKCEMLNFISNITFSKKQTNSKFVFHTDNYLFLTETWEIISYWKKVTAKVTLCTQHVPETKRGCLCENCHSGRKRPRARAGKDDALVWCELLFQELTNNIFVFTCRKGIKTTLFKNDRFCIF